MDSYPLIVDIKRHSLEDGPGIRSVVFFKGCPLQCVFCHNPETQDAGAEIAFSERDCIRCGMCREVCSQRAIDFMSYERINRNKCNACGMCVKVCHGNGLRLVGSYYPVEDLAEILLRDRAFYNHSGGGVTLSGGECTMYPDYIESLLKILKVNNIHITLETSGYFEYETFSQKILPYLDLIYYDIKAIDKDAHINITGKSNQRILDNFIRLIKEAPIEVIPRVPLIPNVTSTYKNLLAIVGFLKDAGAENISLLPYNPMGFEMYVNIGRGKPPLPERFMRVDEEREVYEMFTVG
jgi:pyruvate formate lyase activating enzyme